ncbi:hypothetical protein BHE74_00028440 [Ensete ventricosum]|nr:hypothetical protein BHE74_00028440 [Ensete ventricosum]
MPSTAWARPNKDGPGGYIGRVGDEEPAFCHLLRPSDEATTSPEVEGGRGLNVGRIAWAPHESAEGFGRFALFRGNSGHSHGTVQICAHDSLDRTWGRLEELDVVVGLRKTVAPKVGRSAKSV